MCMQKKINFKRALNLDLNFPLRKDICPPPSPVKECDTLQFHMRLETVLDPGSLT